MKKISCFLSCLVFCMLVLTGCGKNSEQIVEGTGLYYLNTEGTGLVKEKHTIKGTSAEEKIDGLLEEMQKETDCIDYVSPFKDEVKIEDWKLRSGMLDIYFNVKYNNMDSSSKVLLRAAIIQTLTQIKEVEYVSFFAAGQPVTDGNGQEIGYQSAEDFVQNVGSSLHSYQKGELYLYFVSADGKCLKGENVSVRYNSNMSKEKLIVEELIEGPMSSELQATFPSDTKVLGVSIKDGICYVNFDANFLTNQISVDPKLTIYSLVNSLVEGTDAAKVQILVNGEVNVKYQESVDLSQPFSRNLDIIEEEE